MEKVSDETRTLRRTMRELVALSALPAVWAGYQPRQVAEGLADVLLSTLSLDLVYLRLPGQREGQEIEVARTAGRPTTTDETRNIGRALALCLEGGAADSAPSILNPAGGGIVRLDIVRIGGDGADGVLVAGSQQSGFPSETDHLLLTVGANQAATVLQRQRAEEALRASEERFRFLVQNSWDIISLFDAEGTVLFQSPSIERLLGHRMQDRIGRNVFRDPIVHPEDTAAKRAFFNAIRNRPGAPVTAEFRLRHADGLWRDIEAIGQNFLDDPSVAGIVANYRDITERKRWEEALRESNERFRIVTRATNDAVWDWDLNTNKVWCSEGVLTLFGHLLENNETDPGWWLERVHPEDRAAVETHIFDVVRGKELTWVDEYRFRCADGSYKDVYDRGYVLRDREGRAVRMIGAMLDITARKRAEEALRESEHRWRSLTEALPQLVWTCTPDGSCDYLSTQWEQYTGVSAGEQLGFRWAEALHPDDREWALRCWADAVGGRADYDVEFRLRRADGVHRWFKTRGVPIRDREGQIFKWFGTCTDITTGKQLEEELRLANSRLDLAVRSSNVAIWEIDMPDGDYRHGRRYYVNIWEQLGYERPDSPLDHESGLAPVHPDDRGPVDEAVRRYLAGETSEFEVESRLRHKDGSYRWMLSRGVAVRDAGGKPIRFVGTGVDLTDHKRLEAELRHAKESAESANRAKDEFLANVSHEIRTPMNAILGMTELTLDTSLTDDQRQCLRTVKSAADSLLGLINDLLDFSKIEAGKLELDPADFSLRAAVGDTLRALATRAHTKGLELAGNVQPDVPDALFGDAGRLRQVLLNLVGNAIKFTEHGEVVVRVEAVGSEVRGQRSEIREETASLLTSDLCPLTSDSVGLRFTVTDSGIGIPRDKRETIFRAFEQEDTSTTRKYGGTGLGLTIAARLVALMGGAITVHSEPRRGSTFTFTAQFGRQPHSEEQTPARPPILLQGLRVLVVDDNPTNRHILKEWLTGWQMEPVAVGDGLAALGALWDAVSVGRPYPLVLLDSRMADTDGLALAARIRERAALAAVRIILLTSEHRPGDSARSRELRIDARLLKPVQQDELLETIYRVMSRAQGEPPTAAEEPAREPGPVPVPAAAPLRILLAEDNEFSAQLLEKLLVRRGHRVRLASNGREALVLAGQGAFDLMLLDVHMPELDGFEVVREVRERERVAGGHLPVIALTARSREEDRERCLAAGMDDFLTKPVSAAGLLAAIDRLAPADGVSRPAQAEAGEHLGLLDPVAVLTACGDDAEAVRGMCRTFETYLPIRLTEVGDALRAQDAQRLREAAHKFCPLLFAFSTTAGNVASDLEEHAAQGRLEEARTLVEQLETMTQELMRLAGSLSLDTLRQQVEAIGDRQPPGQPMRHRARDS